jgi:hypothetical protein
MRQVFPLRAVVAPESLPTGSCKVVSTGEPVEFTASSRQHITVSGEGPGEVRFYLWYLAGATREPSLVATLAPGEQLGVSAPDTGMATSWHVRASPPLLGSHTVCVT